MFLLCDDYPFDSLKFKSPKSVDWFNRTLLPIYSPRELATHLDGTSKYQPAPVFFP